MTKELFVTLENSDNQYLDYPCTGKLELFETGADGSLILGVFRRLRVDKKGFDCPVEVRNCKFTYTGETWLYFLTKA